MSKRSASEKLIIGDGKAFLDVKEKIA